MKNAVLGKTPILPMCCIAQAHNPPQLSPPMSLVQMDSCHSKEGLSDRLISVPNIY